MGGKSSTTTQTVKIPPEVLARYNAVNKQAEAVAQTPFQQYSTDPAAFVAQLNQQQLAGIANVNQAAGSYQPYFAGAAGATVAGMGGVNPGELEVGKYMNPFQQSVIDTTMARMQKEQQAAQSGALGTAISSGAFGGDRAGIAAANLAYEQDLARASTLAGLNAQNFEQAMATAQQQQGLGLSAEQANLARLMAGGQQLAGMGQAYQQAGLQGAEAQINAGTLEQQTEQAGKTALYNQFMQEKAYPFQVAQFLANIAMGTGALSGSTTSTTQPGSFWSDRRLKHDIKRIGKTDDGLPIYTFKYKGDPEEQTHIGFMADEVEQHKPDAVGLASNGYKYVDYDRATKAGGGGVAGPYGAVVGSQPGAEGYVPQAFLPVGELMIADSGGLAAAQQSFAQQLAAAAKMGENVKSLSDTWKYAKENWGSKGLAEAQGEGEEARGVVKASGGSAEYLKPGLAAAQQPVEPKSYVADTVESQEEAKKNGLMTPGSAPGAPQSTVGKIGEAAGTALTVAKLFDLSDRRAKHSIRRIGKTDNGMPIYSFKYRGDDRERTHIGFMADEVEREHPDAVSTGPEGLKRVDYSQAHKFYQGGVVRPAYAPGGDVPLTAEELLRQSAEASMPAASRARLNAVEGSGMPIPSGTGSALAGLAPAAASGVAFVGKRFPGLPAANMKEPSGPMGLGVPAVQRDVPEYPIGAVDQPVRPLARPEGLGAARTEVAPAGPQADTGVVARDTYAPIIPLKTQLDFVTHELGRPEYSGYLKQDYADPGEAAVAFDRIYERSGGVGNDVAAANARDIYAAARDGDLSKFPPNVATAYQHFIDSGMSPVHAAGATGRLMVESYAGLDPNARSIDGGGMGAFGVAQWRGDRMKELADYAGVPLESIVAAPASTGEGRYYSHGLSLSSSGGGDEVIPAGGVKPYADRNTIGKMMYDPDTNKLSRNALLSLASGVGAMLASPSQFFLPTVGMGLQGAASTYAGLEKQRADIASTNVATMKSLADQVTNWNALYPENQVTPAQYARMIGMNVSIPETATVDDIVSGAYAPTTRDDNLKKLDYQTFQSGTVRIDGRTVRMQDDPASLRRFINDNGFAAGSDTALGRQVATAENRLAEIEAKGGVTFDVNGNEVVLPSYTSAANTQAQNQANREASMQFRTAGIERTPVIDQQLADTDKQTLIFTQLEAGSLTNETTSAAAVLDALGLPVPEGATANAAMAQEAIKLATQKMMGELGSLPGGAPKAELDRLAQVAADPNLQPEAVKMILAMQKASLLRERDRYALRDQWNIENPGREMDQLAYEQWFAKSRPFSGYYNDVVESMPMFAGEIGSRQKPYAIETDEEFDGIPIGHYYTTPDGVLRQRRN